MLIPVGRREQTADLRPLDGGTTAPYGDLPYAEGSRRDGRGARDWGPLAGLAVPVLGVVAIAAGLSFELPFVAIVAGVVAAGVAAVLVRRGHVLGRRRTTLLGGACGWIGVVLGVAALIFSGGGEVAGPPLVTDEYRITLGECRFDGEFATQEGEFTNLGDVETSQVIEVTFRDADGGYSSGDTTIVQAVPEETVPWEANGAVPGRGSCTITAVAPYQSTPAAP